MTIGEVNNHNHSCVIEIMFMYICIIIIILYAFVELEKQIEQKKIAKDMELRKEQEREERENQRILKEQQLLKEREEREILNERMNKQASLNTIDPSHSKPNSALSSSSSSSSSSQAPTQSLPLSARSADIAAAVRKPRTPNPIVSEPLYSIPEGTDRSSSLGSTFDRSSPAGDMNAAVTAAVRQSTSSSSSSSSSRRDNRNYHLFNKINNDHDSDDYNGDIGYSNNSNRDFSYNNDAVVPIKAPSAAAVASKQNSNTPRIDHQQHHQQDNDGSLMYKGNNRNYLFDKNNDNGYGYDDDNNSSGYSKPSSKVANRNHANDRNKLFDQNDGDDDDNNNNYQRGQRSDHNPMMSRTNDKGNKGELLFDSASVFRTDDVMTTIPPVMSRQKKELNYINSKNDLGDDDIEVYSESRSQHRDGRSHQVDHNDSHHRDDNDRSKQLHDRNDTSRHTSSIKQHQQGHHSISTDASNQNYIRGGHLFTSSFSINQSEQQQQQQQQRIMTPPLSPSKKKVEQQLLSKLNLSSINSARGYNVVTKAQPPTHYAAATTTTTSSNATAAVVGNQQLLAHHSNNNNQRSNHNSNPNKNLNISLNRTLEFESKFLLPDGTLIDNNNSNNSKGKSSVDDDVLDQLIRSSDRGDKTKKKKDGDNAADAISYTSSSSYISRGEDKTSDSSMKILSDIQDTLQSLQHLDDDDDDYDGREVTNNKRNSTVVQSTANKGHQHKQSQAANIDTSSSSSSSIVKRPKSSDSLNRDYDVLQVNKRNNRKLELLRKINGANQIQASHLLSSFDQLDITTAAHNSAGNYSSRPSTTNSMSSSNSYSRPNSANIKVSNILQQYGNRSGSDSARYRYDNIHQSTHDLQDMISLHNNNNNKINSSNNNHHRRTHLPSPDDPDFDNYSDYGL